jgi:crotonobetainyl-CoA:carnitine CoA-transferase CaiB-like acyl-CoA transferase
MSAGLPLEGIRVLDLSRVFAGPLATQMLADLGAEVIKVERPGSGDESRQYGPPFLDADAPRPRDSAFFLCCNRNKQSITLDLAAPRGQEIARDLADQSDVVIENFRVGALARYGLDAATLRARNPRLIHCSISGFGQTGPYRDRPGYDGIFQAMGGLMSTIGYPDDEPNGGPTRVGPSICDVLCSHYAGTAILAALYRRDARGGGGESIDLALMDTTVATLTHYASSYLVSGSVPPRRGNAGNGGVPSEAFPCRDGRIFVTAGNDGQYRRLCRALGREDLMTHPDYATGPLRIANRDALSAALRATFRTHSVADWHGKLLEADVPNGPINEIAQVFDDPQVLSRGMLVERPHANGRTAPMVANPIHYAEAPLGRYEPAPLLGQHTEAVLGERLGLDAAAIAALRRDGVV